MLKKREKTKKVCPRCKSVCYINDKTCDDCGLNFEKLQYASNKLAKKNFLAKKRDEIIKVPYYPQDVNKITTILLCIFLGYFGAHNFYVGRYYKGFFQFLMGAFTLTMVVIAKATSEFYNRLIDSVILIIGVFAIWWLMDIVAVIFGNYKIPVSIDLSLMPKAGYSRDKNSL